MGKIKERLDAQLQIPEYADDAKTCMVIYDYLKKVDDGHIWESRWTPLVRTLYKGKYPAGQTIYVPTDIGRMMVKQLKAE